MSTDRGYKHALRRGWYAMAGIVCSVALYITSLVFALAFEDYRTAWFLMLIVMLVWNLAQGAFDKMKAFNP